jgi:hypothetical protein
MDRIALEHSAGNCNAAIEAYNQAYNPENIFCRLT